MLNRRDSYLIIILALAAGSLLFGGCATTRPVVTLPYTMPPVGPIAATTAPAAEITAVTDTREDRSLDAFLNEPASDFLRKAISAELVAGGAFSGVEPRAPEPRVAPIDIEVDLHELSWAVPNHAGMVKTAFWTSFLTGGIGGLAYGATETPVYGHAAVGLKITERASSRVIFNETIDAVHEERTAKLKCDTPQTRARVMASALKAALAKATAAIVKAAAVASTP